jgi:hypothetical protein
MGNNFAPEKGQKKKSKAEEVEAFLARSRGNQGGKEKGYREQSLKIHPWICARCAREFTNRNVHELTVHHKDHNHESNPPDGSNWENLCIYCHENEHRRHLDFLEGAGAGVEDKKDDAFTHNPFDKLKGLLKK